MGETRVILGESGGFTSNNFLPDLFDFDMERFDEPEQQPVRRQ